jgi:hypothetical protein
MNYGFNEMHLHSVEAMWITGSAEGFTKGIHKEAH